MDSVLPLVCLVIGIAMPLGALFLLVRRAMLQLAVASAYGDVSRRLGLEVDTRGLSLQGHLGDRRLWIGQVMVGHGRQRRTVLWGVLDLDRPLGLGLMVRRRGLSERLFRRSRAPELVIDDKELGRAIEVRGDDPDRIGRLLTSDVLEAIRKVLRTWPDLVITDQSVRVHLPKALGSSGALHELVEALQALAAALELARREVDVPARLELLVGAWRDMAERLGLQVDAWLPSLHGELERHRVVVTPCRDADGYSTELRLYFADHLDMGLRVRPQEQPDGYWSVGQDIQVGDRPFDAAFVIKGYDPERIRALFAPPVRARLVALAEAGRLELDDRCMLLRGLPLDPAELEPVIRKSIAVPAALGW